MKYRKYPIMYKFLKYKKDVYRFENEFFTKFEYYVLYFLIDMSIKTQKHATKYNSVPLIAGKNTKSESAHNE